MPARIAGRLPDIVEHEASSCSRLPRAMGRRGRARRRLWRPDPGQPDAAPDRPRDCRPTPSLARTPADRLPARRRSARPADRVVVLHGPPSGGGRPAVRVRGCRLPGGAGRLPGDLGVPPGAHRRGRRRFWYDQRSEIGPQVDRSPRDAGGADRLRDGDRGLRPEPARRRSAGEPSGHRRIGRGRCHPGRSAGRGAVAAGRQRSGSRSTSGRRSPRRSTTTTASRLRPAGGSYYYSRTRHDAPGTLALDGERARRSTASPGSTTSGATSSPWAAAAGTGSRSTSTTARTSRSRSSGTRTGSYPLAYGTLVDAPGRARALGRGDVRPGRGSGPDLDQPARRLPPTRPGGDRAPARGPGDRPRARPSPTRSSTHGDDRRRLLGGLAGRDGDPWRRPSAARPTWSSPATRPRSRDRPAADAAARGRSALPSRRGGPRMPAVQVELSLRGDYAVSATLAIARWRRPW